jgi:ABC-type transport system involved in multi-copper enzyme maturation permease subunit
VLIGLLLLYFVVMTFESWTRYGFRASETRELSPGELARLGSNLFATVIWLQSGIILFLTPAFLAGAIAEDRQRKLLSYLLASPLAGGEIVLGKLAARLINLVILVAVGLPVVSLALLFGGIEPAEVWIAYAASFSTLYFLAGLSIFFSTYSPRPREAILRSYMFGLIWFLLPFFEWLIIQGGGTLAAVVIEARPITEWITRSSPCSLLVGGPFNARLNVFSDVFLLIGLQLTYGTVLLAWSTMRLRPIEKDSRLWGFRWLGSMEPGEAKRLFQRRPCGNAPMIWKECTSTLLIGSRLRTAIMLLLGLGVVVGLCYWVYELGLPAIQEALEYGYGPTGVTTMRSHMNTSVRILTAILYVLMGLMLASSAATGFTTEREKDTWVSLISTPLDGREIVTGKILGAFWRVRGLLATLLLIWLMGVVSGAVHPLGLLAVVVLTSLYALFIALVATCFSLRCKSSVRSVTATIGVLVFLNGGYLFCCVPFMHGSGEMVFLAGFTPMIVTGAVFTFTELEAFFHLSHGFTIPSRADVSMLVFFSVVLHASAAFALLHTCLNQFETVVDRPRKSPGISSILVSRHGIFFEDETVTSDEGISYLDTAEPIEHPPHDRGAEFSDPQDFR